MCACSTALWTHIRSLVHKGKVGLPGAGVPGAGRGRALSPQPCPPAGCAGLSSGRGGMGRKAQELPASGGNQKGSLSTALSPLLKLPVGDAPGGPVVRTPRFHCRGQGFDPKQGTKIQRLHSVAREVFCF